MRQGDRVQIAAAANRDAMRERKQRYFNESNKVSPVLFASGLGALAGGVIEPDESAPLHQLSAYEVVYLVVCLDSCLWQSIVKV